jgi:NAD(P)-dependent dehydrogenase (short-subunit alcohol dehydrogenase family)
MKNFFIVGASSGIGKALTHILHEDGHKVYGTYLKNHVQDNGAIYRKLDVLEEGIEPGFLPDQLDGLVYCPGSINLKPFHRIKPEAFVSDFELQVIGAIKIIQSVMPNLKAAENPSIVLFSTVAVQQGFNFHSQVSTSKGALEGLTRSLAAEFAPKIRVNAIAPSLTNTPLAGKLLSTDEKVQQNNERHPLKRIGEPLDIAQMASFLLSDKSSWVTGQILKVDGGMSSLKS